MKKKSILVLCLIMAVLILITGCTPSVQFGKLTINSTPQGARVYIDGVDTGSVTPLVKNLEAGDHTIKLTKDLYKNWEGIVTVVANQDESINPALEIATIVQEIIKPDGTEGKDSFASSAVPDDNFGNSTFGFIGSSVDSPSIFIRGYFQYDLSAIPSTAVVTSANFALYYAGSGSDDLPLGLYKVLEEWDEAVITWNNQPQCSTESEYTCTIYSGSTTGVYKYWYNLADLIQGWLDGSIVDYGIMIRDADESSLNTMAMVGSSESDEEYRPKLTINYYVP
ncbi:hypothetical protein CVT91_15940 [Candidatus Atribacteria bacterium HGW-Atribacteria-1]|nr:MAG: hypothetical protein CVT91_15940 [Candidatus Atribacteria bacterium HGW-Atribacteria-1]